jgi:pentatricopeptide repeat protein
MFTPLLIGTGSVVLFATTLLFFLKRREQRGAPTLYMDALNDIIEEKHEHALEKLKRTVKADTDNIMAYIYLGDMFRKLNLPIRASKIHRNLLVRDHLQSGQLTLILHRLILDYRLAGLPAQAIEVAERLIQLNKHDLEVKRLLLSLYEEKEDWDKAFFHRQSLNRWIKKKDQDILALYRTQSGLVQVSEGREREGRIRFREAIKLDKHCTSAYLNWVDSYCREGRYDDALRILRDFMQNNPDWAHLGFDRLKMVLYDLGRYGDIEAICSMIIRKKPKKPDVYLALIDFYIREGRFEKALDLAQKTIEMFPDQPFCRLAMIQIYRRQQKTDKALEEALELLSSQFRADEMLICRTCGYETSDPLWRCPKCHQWKTFLDES